MKPISFICCWLCGTHVLRLFILVPAALFFILLSSPCHSKANDDIYRIGAGDLLNLSVWKNADLTRQLAVQPDGIIHLPLAGKIKVQGLSVGELKRLLEKRFSPYISDPFISVSVLQINSLVVYVTGKVNKPGRFLLHDNLNVLQVLTLAGGLTPFAKEKEIRILRKSNGETQKFGFNYKAVSKGKELDQNIRLKKGDVIVVK